MKVPLIDRDKLRTAIRKLGYEYAYEILDAAIDLLADDKLAALIKPYVDPARLAPEPEADEGLLTRVQAFVKASMAREYYEGFNVNSQNYMQKSAGTVAWLSECERLLRRCAAEAESGNSEEVLQAFEILFDLLEHVDEGNDDVVFFASEGGSWQVCVDWKSVLPAWFRLLSPTVGPEEYVQRVVLMVGYHCSNSEGRLLASAIEAAGSEQQHALKAALRDGFAACFSKARAAKHAIDEALRVEEARLAREKYLDDLDASEPAVWVRVEALLDSKRPTQHEEAAKLLVDLRDVAARRGDSRFGDRLAAIKMAHWAKRKFLRQLGRVGL